MTNGPRTVTTLLAVIAITLGPSSIVGGSPAARAQPPCEEDCGNSDGSVNVPDLLQLLSNWGLPGPCDFDGDDVTAVPDLLQLLAAWGACP